MNCARWCWKWISIASARPTPPLSRRAPTSCEGDMAADAWLPIGFALPDGCRLSAILHAGPDWQILAADQERRALIVQPFLLDRWVAGGLLHADWAQKLKFGARGF